jgi:hypothetical protein
VNDTGHHHLSTRRSLFRDWLQLRPFDQHLSHYVKTVFISSYGLSVFTYLPLADARTPNLLTVIDKSRVHPRSHRTSFVPGSSHRIKKKKKELNGRFPFQHAFWLIYRRMRADEVYGRGRYICKLRQFHAPLFFPLHPCFIFKPQMSGMVHINPLGSHLSRTKVMVLLPLGLDWDRKFGPRATVPSNDS